MVNKELDIWDGFWNTGEANSHNQSFGVTYELPFKLFPFINFISSHIIILEILIGKEDLMQWH